MEKSNERAILVVGHKNPDTDSICSAIAYSNLKNKLTNDTRYIPCSAGALNSETEFVLQYFQIPAPAFIADVYTQVSDIDIRFIPGVSKDLSMREAWVQMRTHMLNTLPITNGDRLEGLVTITDITKATMDVFDNKVLSQAGTSYENIVSVLDGTLLAGKADITIQNGKIVIGAADPELMAQYVAEDDIVILGNREDSQKLAIEKKARCLIICLNASVSDAILQLAEKHDCHILTTPYDTYTTARLIGQSIPISYIMRNENLVTFSTDTPTDEVKSVMAKLRHRDFPVIDENENYVGLISRRSLLDMRHKQLILVDHNEKNQAVDGLSDAEILEIIDHHRLGSVETISPVYFRNQPLGSTATIIAQMYWENQIEIEPATAGILCAAIISDTLMFRSPTCTPADKEIAEKLSKIVGIEIEPFAIQMFAAGSNLSSKTDEEIFYQDYKKFNAGEVTFAVGQITSMDKTEFVEVKERLTHFLEKNFAAQSVDMLFFLMTDIINESSELIFWGNGASTAVTSAFNDVTANAEDLSVLLPGIVSRKKQFIPPIISALREL